MVDFRNGKRGAGRKTFSNGGVYSHGGIRAVRDKYKNTISGALAEVKHKQEALETLKVYTPEEIAKLEKELQK